MRSFLSGRLVSLLVVASASASLGCGADPESPTAPVAELEPAFGGAAAAAIPFRQITAGGRHTCGIAPDGRAYCWGRGTSGQLGDGRGATSTPRPSLVAGGLRFAQLSAGTEHTCGVTTDNRAYCWGANFNAQLGDGTSTGQRLTPVAVAGGRRFRQIDAGDFHTCAVNPFDVAFCWGAGGMLGDGTAITRLEPVRVAGGLRFRRVTAGNHTCGVTTDDRAFCWGDNFAGQLGDGTTTNRRAPVAVAGGLSFRLVVPGSSHTCGVAMDRRAYCWGDNDNGQVGTGTHPILARTPVPVAGMRRFRQAVAGDLHSCGVTMSDVAFCWGENFSGQNGDGTFTSSLKPVRVAGGLRFSAVSTGARVWDPFGAVAMHSCGVTTDNRTYCWGSNGNGRLGNGTVGGIEPAPVAVVGPM